MAFMRYGVITIEEPVDKAPEGSTKKAEELIAPLEKICKNLGGLHIETRTDFAEPGEQARALILSESYQIGHEVVRNVVNLAEGTRATRISFPSGFGYNGTVDALKAVYGNGAKVKTEDRAI